MKKILIIKLGAIGDVIHTSVIATAIKNAHPTWEVHFLTTEQIKPIIEHCPHIDKVHQWNTKKRKSFKYLLQTAQILRKEKYDVIFNLTRALRNITLSYLALPKKVIGKHNFPNKSWVEEYFETAKIIFNEIVLPERLYLNVEPSSKETIDKLTSTYPRPFITVSPGGEANKNRQGRQWSIDNWNKLIKELKLFNGTIFVTGSHSESYEHSKLKDAVILSGKLSLSESCALFAQSDLVISGDSGPAHIATALGAKTLTLLGSTSPDKIKPYGKNGQIIESPNDCRYCWQKKCKFTTHITDTTPCMNAITTEHVINTIKDKNLI